MVWTDPRLVWNPDEFGRIDSIRINAKHIWLPDITTYNTVSEMKPIMNGFEELTNVVIKSTGMVIFLPPIAYQVISNISLLTAGGPKNVETLPEPVNAESNPVDGFQPLSEAPAKPTGSRGTQL